MKYSKLYIVTILILLFKFNFAQKSDSIFLQLKLDTIYNTIQVEQTFYLNNSTSQTLDELYLHAWANAYSGKNTVLNQIKLEDRKGYLYFSKHQERGKVAQLQFFIDDKLHENYEFQEREFVKIKLPQPWKPNETQILKAKYVVKIPSNVITHYGFSPEKDYLLKFFFLQPATHQNGEWYLQHYKDFEELLAYPTNYSVEIYLPENYQIASDLIHNQGKWNGENREHFRFFLTQNPQKIYTYTDPKTNYQVDFGYFLTEEEKSIYDSILPIQIQYLTENLGELPSKKIFISNKTRHEQNYIGVDDIDAWIFDLKMFTDVEKNSLKLLQILSYEYIDQLFITNKIKNHWIKNGLQTYLQIKYVDQKFPHLKLSGHLSDKVKILGIKPLKFFHLSQLEMNDRYKLLYLYLARQNFDQPIQTNFDELSNINQIAISAFKTGITFYYIDQYLGDEEFVKLIKEFSAQNYGKLISSEGFEYFIGENSPKDLSWFFDDYIEKKDKINFKLLSFRENKETDSLTLKIKNVTQFQGPFQVVGFNQENVIEKQWYQSDEKKFEIVFPKGDYDKIVINPGYLFPEFKDKDNYVHTNNFFKSAKKIQFKLYSDMENPEYSQSFMNPQIRWNNYDKFMLGIKFHNQSLLTKPFKWSILPRYSTGPGKFTGGATIENTFTPDSKLFRTLTIGAGARYEHYDKNLPYRKFYGSLKTNFAKNPRATLTHGVAISFDNLNKEVPQGQQKTDEDRYSLWNLTYYYSRPNFIHDFFGSVTFQMTESFHKVTGEWYYRYRYAPRKRIGVRMFAGIFTRNETNTDYFNFGLSRVSDYAFNYNLLGRSESSGVLSQQFVLSEAGFKSQFAETVNNWVISTNVEIPVWKMIDIYADAGVYKNKYVEAKFLYDTGFRLRIIPEFIELYFPIQSSLGFEPTNHGNYWEKIRFTINLNLSTAINHLRRGWY